LIPVLQCAAAALCCQQQRQQQQRQQQPPQEPSQKPASSKAAASNVTWTQPLLLQRCLSRRFFDLPVQIKPQSVTHHAVITHAGTTTSPTPNDH
jgi:hypothetical protein